MTRAVAVPAGPSSAVPWSIKRRPATIGCTRSKFDGYRTRASSGGVTVLRSRKGLDWTHVSRRSQQRVMSCRIASSTARFCAVDKNEMPHFAGLLRALSTKKTADLIFFVFDLLYRDREDIPMIGGQISRCREFAASASCTLVLTKRLTLKQQAARS
jgi:hypothetical protein